MRRLCLLLVLFLVAGLAAEASAAKPPVDVVGIWAGLSKAKFALKRLGKWKDPYGVVAVALDEMGGWAALDDEDILYGGDYTRVVNKLTMTFDAEGQAGLREAVVSWIEDLADDEGVFVEDISVMLTSTVLTAKAKETKKRGKLLKYKLKAKFDASADVDGDFVATSGKFLSKGTLEYYGIPE